MVEKNAGIIGSFCYLPSRIVGNSELSETYDCQTLTGIKERRYAQPHEASSDMAFYAAQSYLNFFSETADKIRTLIVATTSGDFLSPATASVVHHKLGLSSQVHGFDVASSCTSFLSAARCSLANFEENSYSLVIATEVKHKSLPENNHKIKVLFGDGSAGFLMGPSKYQQNFCFLFSEMNSDYVENICIPVGGSRNPVTKENHNQQVLTFQDPRELYRITVKLFLTTVEKAWTQRCSSFPVGEVVPGFIFLHQANANLILEIKKRLPPSIAARIPVFMSDVGNMVCASLPALRVRVLFLFSLFCYFKEISELSYLEKNGFSKSFERACKESTLFSCEISQTGFVVVSSYFKENIVVTDGAAQELLECWLERILERDFRELLDCFFYQSSLWKNYHLDIAVDLWIGAGGGLQAMALLSYFYMDKKHFLS